MCGFFAGIFTPDTAPDDGMIERALKALAHRGPDGRDWIRIDLPDGRVAVMGHARLALVGIERGRQPFVSSSHATVVNGEFYGWRDRRRAMERLGASFRSDSDSELAHAAFGLHGAGEWLDQLDGEWAACAIDFRECTMHAAVDPFGTKPLRHWTSRDGRTVVVASEAKALFELGIRPELDERSLRFALTLQYLPVGSTLFRSVGMLPPGCRTDHVERGLEIESWSDLALGAPLKGRPATSRQTLDALQQAVVRRIPSERSFATHLSGGLDSALVLALASRTQSNPIDAFTADFTFGSNEAEQAAETASHCGARLVRVRMDAGDLVDATDQAAAFSESLCINAHAGAKILIASAVASAGHPAVLTGEGADEAFWGYEHLRLDAGLTLHDDAAANTAGIHRPAFAVDGLNPLSKALSNPVPTFIRTKAAMTMPLQEAFGPRLLTQTFRSDDLARSLPTGWINRIKAMPAAYSARALWNLHGLSGYILRGLDDAMGMSRGVESRLAFLDPSVQRLASTVAPEAHFDRHGLEKRLLRDAASGLIPETVLRRRKAPFMAPRLTGTPEGDAWIRDRLTGGPLSSSGLFDPVALERIVASPDGPVRDANLMTLASLSRLMTTYRLG